MERDILGLGERQVRFEEPSARSVINSLSKGGIMLEVLPLARQRFSPTEISQLTGIPYRSVLFAEIKMRRNRLIPESHIDFNRRLVKTLENLPEDPDLRRDILSLVKYYFYRNHPEFFTTPSECLKLAGLSDRMTNYRRTLAVINSLQNARISLKEFTSVRYDEGKMRVCSTRIMYKAEQDQAVNALRRSTELAGIA